jgi:hypothetical protein
LIVKHRKSFDYFFKQDNNALFTILDEKVVDMHILKQGKPSLGHTFPNKSKEEAKNFYLQEYFKKVNKEEISHLDSTDLENRDNYNQNLLTIQINPRNNDMIINSELTTLIGRKASLNETKKSNFIRTEGINKMISNMITAKIKSCLLTDGVYFETVIR